LAAIYCFDSLLFTITSSFFYIPALFSASIDASSAAFISFYYSTSWTSIFFYLTSSSSLLNSIAYRIISSS